MDLLVDVFVEDMPNRDSTTFLFAFTNFYFVSEIEETNFGSHKQKLWSFLGLICNPSKKQILLVNCKLCLRKV
jgi:hypothetical protein